MQGQGSKGCHTDVDIAHVLSAKCRTWCACLESTQIPHWSGHCMSTVLWRYFSNSRMQPGLAISALLWVPELQSSGWRGKLRLRKDTYAAGGCPENHQQAGLEPSSATSQASALSLVLCSLVYKDDSVKMIPRNCSEKSSQNIWRTQSLWKGQMIYVYFTHLV